MDAQTCTPLPRLAYSMDEVAESLDLSRRTLNKFVRTGVLRTIKLGGRRLVPAEELRRLCSVQEVA